MPHQQLCKAACSESSKFGKRGHLLRQLQVLACVASQAVPFMCPLQNVPRRNALHAGANVGSLSSGVGQPQVLDFAIRSAAVEDYWSIAEVHAQSFYPSANWLLGPLLRLDRVHALQVGCALCMRMSQMSICTTAVVGGPLRLESHCQSVPVLSRLDVAVRLQTGLNM